MFPRSLLSISSRVSRLSNCTTFTRANSSLSNTASTVKAVNSAKPTNQRSSPSLNSVLGKSNHSGFYAESRSSSIITAEKARDPYDFATNFILPDKLAGRSVSVVNKDLDRAIYQLDSLVRANRLREINFDQRFYTKPNKRRLAKRVANRKRVFESGIAKLFEVVKDAVRKGY